MILQVMFDLCGATNLGFHHCKESQHQPGVLCQQLPINIWQGIRFPADQGVLQSGKPVVMCVDEDNRIWIFNTRWVQNGNIYAGVICKDHLLILKKEKNETAF